MRRFALQVSALVAAGSVGFLLAVQPPSAAADGLLPTVTVPTLPVTVPTVSLPTTTVTTPVLTTTVGATTTTSTTTVTIPVAGAGSSSASPAAAASDAAAATVADRTAAGAVLLSGGTISIPVKSVVAPNGLRLLVTLAPRVVDAKRRVTATIRVRDARGYPVRGARVTLQSVPGGLLAPLAHRLSAADGHAGFVVRAKPSALKSRRLWLLVTAADPARAKSVSVTRTVAVAIAARNTLKG